MYRNVDLEISSLTRLDALREALAESVLVLYEGREGRRWRLHADVNGSGRDRTPGKTIRRWIEVLTPLRGEARRLFRAARVRASVGVDAAAAPYTSVVIEAAAVAALATLGVEIEVVVYRS